MKRKLPKVYIIILNWNGWADTLDCLNSLYQIDYPSYEIILVDNHSSNNSVEKIKAWSLKRSINNNLVYFSINNIDLNSETYQNVRKKLNKLSSTKKLLLIKNDKNLGFSEGNNIVIRRLIKDKVRGYVLLLNNDTVVQKDFLKILVTSMQQDRGVTVAGPKMYYHNFAGKKNIIWFGGGKIDWKRYPGYFHESYNKSDYNNRNENKLVETDWISGACMLVDINNVKLIGDNLLSPDFYLGCEDVDLCLRENKRGAKIIYNPNAYIWHKVGKSRPTSFKQILRSTRTNLKLNKIYNKYFLLYLPKYIFTIPLRYLFLTLNKVKTGINI